MGGFGFRFLVVPMCNTFESNPEEMIRKADKMMYENKKNKYDHIRV